MESDFELKFYILNEFYCERARKNSQFFYIRTDNSKLSLVKDADARFFVIKTRPLKAKKRKIWVWLKLTSWNYAWRERALSNDMYSTHYANAFHKWCAMQAIFSFLNSCSALVNFWWHSQTHSNCSECFVDDLSVEWFLGRLVQICICVCVYRTLGIKLFYVQLRL